MVAEKDIQHFIARASEGDVASAQRLLDIAYSDFENSDRFIEYGKAITGAKEGLSARARYAAPGLLIKAGEGTISYELLRDLAWDDKYAPAQWRLGRMLANEEVLLADADRSVGFDLLHAARKNGHLRATQSILVAKAKYAVFLCQQRLGSLHSSSDCEQHFSKFFWEEKPTQQYSLAFFHSGATPLAFSLYR